MRFFKVLCFAVALTVATTPTISSAAPAKRILCAGDSITAGGPILGTNPNWCSLLGTALRSYNVAFHNVGVGGYTSTQLVTLLSTSYYDADYTHWMILIGTNDLASGTAAATILANIQTIVTAATARGIPVAVGYVLPRKNAASYSADLQTRLNAVNAGIAAMSGITAVDMYTAMGDPGDATALAADADVGDGLHPNGTVGMPRMKTKWQDVVSWLAVPNG